MSDLLAPELEPDLSQENIFEFRAEHLSEAELTQWTFQTEDDKRTLSKLKGPGSKLLRGPRGSGKSTLLRRAYFDLLQGREVLAVYVNYSRSLALEPLFHRDANALEKFRQWVLMKIVEGIGCALRDAGRDSPANLSKLCRSAQKYIAALETGDSVSDDFRRISPSELCAFIEQTVDTLGYRRSVLLLDDAAHAFSSEQQNEFFEVFRQLRSRVVAPKAAIYPGITSFSPNFHIGHEAEIVDAWYRPDSPEYLFTMSRIVERRLPGSLVDLLRDRQEVVDYLAFASFGLPRGFLVMLSQVLGIDEGTTKKPTISDARSAVNEYAETVRGIFRGLAIKLPRFKKFVDMGEKLEQRLAQTLKEYNSHRPNERKAVALGIADPQGRELSKMLSFLEYAGVVRKQDSVSKGEKGTFQRYALHYAIILSENVLAMGSSAAIGTLVQSLKDRDAHSYVRTRGESLLGRGFQSECTLELDPCRRCGMPRVSEDARFCSRCGEQLTEASVYEELLKSPVDRLPLPPRKIRDLKEIKHIKTIQDVLLDAQANEIREIPYIGKVWAKRIKDAAEEFVGV